MFTEDFYEILSDQLDPIINENIDNLYFQKKDNAGKHSFAFLLWFIQRYNPDLTNVSEYVTDGNDDSSCDIIFPNKDNLGETVYYVVQSKWNEKSNIKGYKGVSNVIKACLSDFELILSGEKEESDVNLKFNNQYKKLLEHKENGGRIKFVFLCLCKLEHEAHSNINRFKKDLIEFEEIDINRLKRDYIEMEYKGARTHNPIEHPYEPKGEIMLSVLKNNKVDLALPYKSHIFLVRPSLIHELFGKYGFSLFYKNIRNPLFDSNYNIGIAKTIINSPENFWYFNNGITAITEKIPIFHADANTVKIYGLQVINGAQTVFSIHDAYSKANSAGKERIDKAYVTLRVIESKNPNFDVDITRYTNSQNPVSERDFRSNDDTQKRLQTDFFNNTNIWYERRRGEFRSQIKGIERIANENFAQAYLAYYLQRPVDSKQKSGLIFKAKADGGFYEDVFNSTTSFQDMQIAYYFQSFIEDKKRFYKKRFDTVVIGARGKYLKKDLPIIENQFILHASSHILALFKSQFGKQYKHKNELYNKVCSDWNNSNFDRWDSIYERIIRKLKVHVKKQETDIAFALTKYFKSGDDENQILSLLD
jgi:hypothetical protein